MQYLNAGICVTIENDFNYRSTVILGFSHNTLLD